MQPHVYKLNICCINWELEETLQDKSPGKTKSLKRMGLMVTEILTWNDHWKTRRANLMGAFLSNQKKNCQ